VTIAQSRRRFLLGVFVVSGFTGLIYESIWSHYLQLFLGHAAYAQTLVLAIYMGGMAAGSWLMARQSVRIRGLLRRYVLVEGLIGVLGIAFHPLFVAATDVSFAIVIPAISSPWLTGLYKWSLGAALILPQSVLLGMTFPLISGGLIRCWPEHPGETLAMLYFTNSLGAAIGVLVSGFVLIAAVGLPGTILTAGLLNLLLAAAVWVAVRGSDQTRGPAVQSAAGSGTTAAARPAAGPGALTGPGSWTGPVSPAVWLTAAAFLTGAASFMYELGWIRMLSLVLGSSTHSFELMLSAFILGLAFGGLAVRRRIERLTDPVRYLAVVFMVMGALAALTLPAYNQTFDVMAWCLRVFPRNQHGYIEFNLLSQLIAAVIMIPATFCAGMTLPLLTHALMRRGAGERAIGTVYAANTLGAIVGVLLAIHVLLPLIGIKGVILSGAAIHVLLGGSRVRAGQRPLPWRLGCTALACLGALLFALLGVRLDPLRMTSGVYRTGVATLPEGAVVRYLRDGKTATISLVEKNGRVTIATNGKPDAGIQMGPGEPSPDEVTMVMAAAVPLSMQPHPLRVANIGFGSGLTTHTLLASERVQRLDSIEIEPFMVQAAREGYSPRIDNVFDDPRSHIVFDDAKTFLASAHAPYDLIVSEPSNPWVSGVATLFSDEFYARISHYLAPDGYFAQWMQVYETNTDIVASVIKALAPHFGAYAIYNVDDVDMLIIATRSPNLRAPDDALLQSPLMQSELLRVGIQSVDDFKSREMGSGRTIGALVQSMPAPANSDFHPYIDLNAPRARYLRQTAIDLPALTVLPIPVLELLGGAVPPNPTVEPADNSAVFRDGLVRRAIRIRDAMASGDVNGLDPESARSISRLSLSRERCGSADGQAEWLATVAGLSDATASYLSREELAPMWLKIEATPCFASLAGEARAQVELLAAIARRDAATVARLGTQLLAASAAESDERVTYLTVATVAACVRSGDLAQGRAVLQAQWPRVHGSDKFGFALRDLAAITATRP
jgi:predicted membrane-bound spermidine synthase